MKHRSIIGTLATTAGVLHLALSLHFCGGYDAEAVGGEIHVLGSVGALVGAVGFTWVGARYLGPKKPPEQGAEPGPRQADRDDA